MSLIGNIFGKLFGRNKQKALPEATNIEKIAEEVNANNSSAFREQLKEEAEKNLTQDQIITKFVNEKLLSQMKKMYADNQVDFPKNPVMVDELKGYVNEYIEKKCIYKMDVTKFSEYVNDFEFEFDKEAKNCIIEYEKNQNQYFFDCIEKNNMLTITRSNMEMDSSFNNDKEFQRNNITRKFYKEDSPVEIGRSVKKFSVSKEAGKQDKIISNTTEMYRRINSYMCEFENTDEIKKDITKGKIDLADKISDCDIATLNAVDTYTNFNTSTLMSAYGYESDAKVAGTNIPKYVADKISKSKYKDAFPEYNQIKEVGYTK